MPGRNEMQELKLQASSLLRELIGAEEGRRESTADDLLVFLYRLRDNYQAVPSVKNRSSRTSLGFLHDIVYQLESRPDEVLQSEGWRSRIEQLLGDLAEGELILLPKGNPTPLTRHQPTTVTANTRVEGKMKITAEKIREVLSGFHRTELGKTDLKRAAVLMLFYPKGDELYVLLTKRTEDVEHHKGQISFPGGSCDVGDDHVVATALRESMEEIGLPATAFEVLGIFNEYETPSGFAITPVVAYAPSLPPLKCNVAEVAEILEVPVGLFLDKRYERVERRNRLGRVIDVYFYRFGNHEIWGATAAILRAFLHSLPHE